MVVGKSRVPKPAAGMSALSRISFSKKSLGGSSCFQSPQVSKNARRLHR